MKYTMQQRQSTRISQMQSIPSHHMSIHMIAPTLTKNQDTENESPINSQTKRNRKLVTFSYSVLITCIFF